MTQRDFILIAGVLRDASIDGPLTDEQDALTMAERFADALAEGNPRFKRDLFLDAATGGR